MGSSPPLPMSPRWPCCLQASPPTRSPASLSSSATAGSCSELPLYRSRHALELADLGRDPLSDKREHGSLGVHALEHPLIARHLDEALDDLAVARIHTLSCQVNVIHVEVVEPEGLRNLGGFGEHAARGDSSGGEALINA